MRATTIAIGVVLLAIAACDHRRSAEAATPDGSSLRPPTTAPGIYFSNLAGQIEAAKVVLARDPASVAAHRNLSALTYVMGRYHGELDEIQRAIDHASAAIARAPSDPALYLQRATQQQTLHRFAAARLDLEQARTLGGDVAPLEAELDYAEGKYDRAIPVLRATAAADPTMRSVARLAALEHALGREAEARQAFDAAVGLVRDTNPVPVAWLEFQRAMFEIDVGQPEKAIQLFRTALRRTPDWVSAQEHLAEVLAEVGQVDPAIAIYESIVKRSSDPEFKGALASLYRRVGRANEADALVATATAEYERMIRAYPEAMAAHASEFFLGVGGNPQRGLELAEADVRARPTVQGLTSLARAYLLTGQRAAAQATLERALALPVTSVALRTLAAQLQERGTATEARR